jgi:2-oxoglutarate dehydrogenase E2 component (dihydrolipoamide succinyltransferase)
MKNEIKVPAMGESISSVIIGQILAPTGTLVKTDAEILELETDKVNQILYAHQEGKVSLVVQTGDTAVIGQVIGHIEPTNIPSQESSKEVKQAKAPKLEPIEAPKEQFKGEPEKKPHGESANVRKTKEAFLDELKHSKPAVQSKMEPVFSTTSPPSKRSETRQPMSKIRKVIANRLVEAQHNAAMLTTFNEVDLSLVMQMREKYKENFSKKYQAKLGFMSFFVKATAAALKVFPVFNSYLDREDIVHREYYDIGIAVGTEKGVIVPVLRDCDRLNFAGIEQAIENFAKKAREGTLKADDLQGAGFTITNGGVYGSLLSTPILNPPQCGILGMHKIEKRPIVIDDQIVIRPMMYLALSYDHRLADGKDAVSFLVYIKNMLEDPSRLLLEI